MLQSILKVIRGIVKLRGATDNTLIGNSGDRLKVDSIISVDVGSGLDSEQVYSVALQEQNQPTASTNNPLLYLRNPSGSGKNVYILACRAGTVVTNVISQFGIFGNPTVSANGTSVTPRSFTIGSVVASVVLATTAPTVTTYGNIRVMAAQGQNSNEEDLIGGNYIKVPPGNAVLITGSPVSNNRAADLTVVWIEK